MTIAPKCKYCCAGRAITYRSKDCGEFQLQYRKCDSCGKTQSSKRWLSTSLSASELERFLVPASKKISELVRIGTELDFPHGTRVFIVASMNDDARIEVTEITQPPDSEAGQI